VTGAVLQENASPDGMESGWLALRMEAFHCRDDVPNRFRRPFRDGCIRMNGRGRAVCRWNRPLPRHSKHRAISYTQSGWLALRMEAFHCRDDVPNRFRRPFRDGCIRMNGRGRAVCRWNRPLPRHSKHRAISYTLVMNARADPQQLFASIYDELKRLAHAQLAARTPRTLCTTALVHEAYIKLIRGDAAVQDRQHFVSLVVRAMRQILADAARNKMADKRGNNPAMITLGAAQEAASSAISVDVLALEQAIDRLRGLHERS